MSYPVSKNLHWCRQKVSSYSTIHVLWGTNTNIGASEMFWYQWHRRFPGQAGMLYRCMQHPHPPPHPPPHKGPVTRKMFPFNDVIMLPGWPGVNSERKRIGQPNILDLSHHWFGQRLTACSAPNHNLNQYWLIACYTSKDQFLWNFIRNSKMFPRALKISVCKNGGHVVFWSRCINSE